jgi:hypothetical protein
MRIYDAEEVVDLVALPDDYYHFVEWTGDVTTIADVYHASTTITMNGNYKITANFELEPGWYSLTVSSIEGGSVTQPGEGIYVYSVNMTVDLVAEPDEHYQFVEWTGDVDTVGDVTAAATTITMNNSYSIMASFELQEGWHSLTISSTDGGSVTEPGEGTYIYGNSTVVNLVAVPDEGCQFVRWTGNVSAIADIDAAETAITMNASYSITANFESWHPEPAALLMISSTRGGSVTIPGEGTFAYPLGVEVSLVAEPDEGCQFVNWSGDVNTMADANSASTTIIVDSSYSIKANFSGAGWCFIATAAYGSPMAKEIRILRDFRDEYLLTNPAGHALVDLYYRVSPPIARFITEHPGLKPIVRAGLLPAIAMSSIAVNTTPVEQAAMIGLLVLASVAVAIWPTRRRGEGAQQT